MSCGVRIPIDDLIDEIQKRLKLTGGGIKSGTLVTSSSYPTQVIKVVNKDDTLVDIDVSDLKDIRIESGDIIDGQIIRLYRSDGKNIDIKGSKLIPDSPFIVRGVFVNRDSGYWLDFTRSDSSEVNVDMTDAINKIVKTVFDMVMRMGYRINTQGNDYTLTGDDFDGRTIIRANKNGSQTITLPKPDDSFIGKAIIVRKTAGDVGTFVTLKAGSGVTISPPDATPIRRLGSSVTLVYVGNGLYDAYGELP